MTDYHSTPNKLTTELHAASDAVHRITGKTNVSLNELCDQFPDHPAVLALKKAREAIDGKRKDAAE